MLEFGGGEGRLIRAFGGCAELLVDFWTGAPIYEQILPSTLKFR